MAVFSQVQRHLNPDVSVIEISNAMAHATISMFGGQVLSFRPKHDNRERLFLSEAALFDGSKSIRGGVPVCWPWFGAHASDPALPTHGWARTRRWLLQCTENSLQFTRLVLIPDLLAQPAMNSDLALEMEILIGRSLEIRIRTTNRGKSDQSLNCALHTYLAVSDISSVTLEGLQGTYSDKTLDWSRHETPSPYRIESETDRIHMYAAPTVTLKDPVGDIDIASTGHDSIVVWNPWKDAQDRFVDLLPDDYRHMLCVETALTQPFVLGPDETHLLTQTLS